MEQLSYGMVRGDQVHEMCVWGILSGWRVHEGDPLLQERDLPPEGPGRSTTNCFSAQKPLGSESSQIKWDDNNRVIGGS